MSRENTLGTPTKGTNKVKASTASGGFTPAMKDTTDQQQLDISGLNLNDTLTTKEPVEEPPKVSMAREKVLEEAKRALEVDKGKKMISIVVIGDIFLVILPNVIQLRFLFEVMWMPASPR